MRILNPIFLCMALVCGAALPSQAEWIQDFEPDGLSSAPLSMTEFEGELFLSGPFSRAGNLEVSGVARWSGSKWSSSGPTEVTYNFEKMMPFQGDLYALGTRRDQNSWKSGLFRRGASGWVYTGLSAGSDDLFLHQGKLLVGSGTMRTPDGDTYRGVISWDGQTWESMAYNLSDQSPLVYALEEHNGFLHASVSVRTGNSERLYKVVRLEGRSWVDVGPAFNERVHDIVSFQSELFAGGEFEEIGEEQVRYLASWDGTAWTARGKLWRGVFQDHSVRELLVWEDKLVVAGIFDSIDQQSANSIGFWDGQSWSTIIGNTVVDYDLVIIGPIAQIRCLAIFQGELYVGGVFDLFGHLDMTNLARFDGTHLRPVVSGPEHPRYVWDLFEFNGEMIASGRFTNAGDRVMDRLASFEEDGWHAYGTGGNGVKPVLLDDFVEFQGDLLAAGRFEGLSSREAVCRWDGSNWTEIAPLQGRGNQGYVLEVYKGQIIVGGMSRRAEGEHLKAWNGTDWVSLGIGLDDRVFVLRVHNDILYVGGNFQRAGGQDAKFIAAWDGENWTSFDNGTGGAVLAIEFYQNDLIIGGVFHTTSGVRTNSIARWNGTNWNAMGVGFPQLGSRPLEVGELYVYDGSLVASCYADRFYSEGASCNQNMAVWNGAYWVPTEPKVRGYVGSFLEREGSLYVSGNFQNQDDRNWPFVGIARWEGGLPDGPHPVTDPKIVQIDSGFRLSWRLLRDEGILGFAIDRQVSGSEWETIQALQAPILGDNTWFDQLGHQYIGLQIGYRIRPILAGVVDSDLVAELFAKFLPDMPVSRRLNSPFPNPVSVGSPATIAFSLTESNPTSVQIFAATGRKMKTLALESMGPGSFALTWDGTDDWGQPVASGVYFVHLTSGDFESTQRIVLIP